MLKVGIIGGGFMGSTHAKGYKNIGVNVAAICDIDAKVREEFAQKYESKTFDNASKMMEEMHDLDFIDVCVPTILHEEMVLLACKHNHHVLSEKPFSLSLESIDNMLEKTQQAKSIFMIGQVLHFWPEYVKIKEWVEQGIFGEILSVSATRLGQHPPQPWYADVLQSGGGIFDLHVHDIDFLCYLFGDVKEVYAVGKKNKKNNAWNFVTSTLRFKNGVDATAEAAFGITDNYPFTMSLRIVGELASCEFLFSAGFNLEDLSSARNSLTLYKNNELPHVEPQSTRDPYEIEIEYFANCVKDKKQPTIVKPVDVRKSIEAIFALIESLENGSVVKI